MKRKILFFLLLVFVTVAAKAQDKKDMFNPVNCPRRLHG